MFRHKCNIFCIKCMSFEYSIFIVSNWLSYTLLFSAIAITSLLCYWYIISNFYQILGTNSLQESLFEKWGDILTQYIAVMVHHSSLVQGTHAKVVLCNTMSLSEMVNIWWWEEQSYTFTFILQHLTEISALFIKIHLDTCNL